MQPLFVMSVISLYFGIVATIVFCIDIENIGAKRVSFKKLVWLISLFWLGLANIALGSYGLTVVSFPLGT